MQHFAADELSQLRANHACDHGHTAGGLTSNSSSRVNQSEDEHRPKKPSLRALFSVASGTKSGVELEKEENCDHGGDGGGGTGGRVGTIAGCPSGTGGSGGGSFYSYMHFFQDLLEESCVWRDCPDECFQ